MSGLGFGLCVHALMQRDEAQRNQTVEEKNTFDEERLRGMRRAGGKLHCKEREETALCRSEYFVVLQREYCPTAIKADVTVN